jgi:double-strand break repair protein MRE11
MVTLACSHYLLMMSLSMKGRAKARGEVDDDDARSADSMEMEIDEPGSDFGSDSGHPPPGKKSATSRGKRPALPGGTRKVASGSGRRKDTVSKTSLSFSELRPKPREKFESDEEVDEEMDDDEVPKPTRRTNRAAVPTFVSDISCQS